MATSQTLSRGLTALELIALSDQGPTIEQVASELGVHRSIAYRIIRTLEEHHLVRRDAAGRCRPSIRLAALGRFARPTLQAVAQPELARLADELGVTCFLVVRDGDEALTLESVEPSTSQFHVAYRPGIRHPIDRGAPGLAVLAASPALPGERREVSEARARGWATSDGEVVAGMASVAVPVPGVDAAIATVFLGAAEVDRRAMARPLVDGADRVSSQLGVVADPGPVASTPSSSASADGAAANDRAEGTGRTRITDPINRTITEPTTEEVSA